MRYVVVGGGIAGVSCVKRILDEDSDDEVLLVSPSACVKTVTNWRKVGQFTELFDVDESSTLFDGRKNFKLITALVVNWNPDAKNLVLSDGSILSYDSLCIATGASPRSCHWTDERVITLRDMDSAATFQTRLKCAKRVVIVGNGGIATELAYELKNVHISWIIRDATISSTFFHGDVVQFFNDALRSGRSLEDAKVAGVLKRERFGVNSSKPESDVNTTGAALGPDWCTAVSLEGHAGGRTLRIYEDDEVIDLAFETSAVTASLRSGAKVECDVVIWATGVQPNSHPWSTCKELELASDGGIVVDESMRTSVKDVFACGDVCSVSWGDHSPHWKQMRLWTHARQLGDYTGRAVLSGGETDLDFCFEMFAHVTTFFGFKVVLLGDFLGERHEGWYARQRIKKEELVRCIMLNHRVVGAVLIGETQLEEVIENLILNQIDISTIEEHFLDPGIDIEDYFD